MPLGTGMGLGDWVRVVSRFAGDAGFGGVGQERSRKSSLHGSTATTENSGVVNAQWQPSPHTGDDVIPDKIEDSSMSDDFVENLARDIQACALLKRDTLYATHAS